MLEENHQYFANPVFCLLLTLASYQLGNWLYQKSNLNPLCHPIVLAALPLVFILQSLGIDYQTYWDNCSLLYFFLGPATVALAIPLYQQLRKITAIATPVFLTTVICGSFACVSSLLIAGHFGVSGDSLISIAPKSVSTPIALEIIKITGGFPQLTAGLIVITGIVGVLCAPIIFFLLRIQDTRIKGFTLGLTAHGIGTAKAFEYGMVAGAFSSLALGLTGAFTALLLPSLLPRLLTLLLP